MKEKYIPKQLLIMGINELKESSFNLIKNDEECNKPLGGLWASPYSPDTKFKSIFQQWCSYTMPDRLSKDGVIITLKNDIKSFIIDNQEDLINFTNIVGLVKSQMRSGISPDYEKASKLYDIIYLTEKGQIDTRMPLNNYKFNLYGWDVESALLTNLDCIKKWKYINL